MADGERKASSIAERWGTTPGARVWVGGHDTRAKREVERHLQGTIRPVTGTIDVGLITPQSVEEAVHFASKLRARLSAEGAIWVAEPAGGFDPASGFDIGRNQLATALRGAGFVQTSVLALNDAYRAVRFVPDVRRAY